MMHELLTLGRLRAMAPAEAAALLAYRLAEGVGELDAAIAAEWLKDDPENQAAWEEAKSAWAIFDQVEGDDLVEAMRRDARNAARPRRLFAPWAAAAVLALGVAVGLTVMTRQPSPFSGPTVAPKAKLAAVETTYAASGDALERFTLKDGSKLILAPDTRVAVSFTSEGRAVRLAGGPAHFDVAADHSRPFTVSAGQQTIVALGTRFDVRPIKNGAQVYLEEGRVSVDPGGAPAVVLEAGQEAIAVAGQAVRISQVDGAEAARWREPYLVFDNVTLQSAAAQISSGGGGRLVVRDRAVAALRVSGRFKAGDIPRFGRSIALVHPVRLVKRGESEWEIVASR